MTAPSPIVIDLEKVRQLPEDQQVEELARIQQLQAIMAANPLWSWAPHAGEYGFKAEQRVEWINERGGDLGIENALRADMGFENYEDKMPPHLRWTGQEDRGQVDFMALTKRGVYHGAAVAGNRFGKTEISIVDAAVQTLPWEFIPPWLAEYKVLDPENRAKPIKMRFGGPDEARWLYQTVLPKLRKLLPKGALWQESFDKAWQEKRHILTFKDGSTWDFLTYNMELNAWAGGDLDRITFDEEPKGRHGEDIHEESVGRLADRDGHFRYTLTPVEGIGWLYYLLSDEHGDPRKDDEVFVIRGAIDHNPHVSEKGRKQAIKEWERKDPMRVEARRWGRWVHLEGLIFPEFRRLPEEEGGHICPDRPPPDGASILAVFDPGIDEDHPFALSLGFIDPEDKGLEIFHTHRLYGQTANEMADHYHETLAVFGIPRGRPRRLIDPSARNRAPATGRSMQWVLQRLGIVTRPGQNDRMISYSEIKYRLKTHHQITHRPLLRIQASCDGDLGDEMVNYRWKKPRTRTDNEPTNKPEPIKIKDDLIDTVRYMCMDVRVTDSSPHAPSEMEDPTPTGIMRRRIKELASRNKRGKVGGVW
jgi:hypothetical protein